MSTGKSIDTYTSVRRMAFGVGLEHLYVPAASSGHAIALQRRRRLAAAGTAVESEAPSTAGMP